jgi:DNA (cytosine-5)-methyltransferase 1
LFYSGNFAGDITKVNEKDIPDFDFLFAGFPCQPN